MKTLRNVISLPLLAWVSLMLLGIGCAEGEPAAECPCGVYALECVPCPEGDTGVLPGADYGTPFLNEELIDEEKGYFLNQEGDGTFQVYTNEDNEIGVRVVNYFGNP